MSSDAICLIIDTFLRITCEGAGLKDVPGAVGIGLVQFRAQHTRAAFASGDRSLLLALSQQDIIWLFIPVCSGVPASTPPARAKTTNRVVSHRFIVKLTILDTCGACQELYIEVVAHEDPNSTII